MTPVLTIAKKRDGLALSRQEIATFIGGYARGEIPDYQMAALAMAIYLRGMDAEETAALTEAMLASGVTIDWGRKRPSVAGGAGEHSRSECSTLVVDKHSTGGIGDKTSLILAPLLACCGLAVPMISGRGLGATGGTLDKLESIRGFRTDLSLAEIRDIVERVGCVITGATAELAPADKRLYALRDVTATVASIPLITASIMSKKLAEGLDALVLDVKFGSGAFMKSLQEARRLAESLVETGKRMGVKTAALLTDMNQPLGRMAGNAVEIDEALAALGGQGPADLMEVTLSLGAELLVLAGRTTSTEAAREVLQEHIASGRALKKFGEMVAAQGGDLDAPRPIAPAAEVLAEGEGYVATINAEQLGLAIIELGGGRRLMTDRIDHSVGLEMLVRVGDAVQRGQPLVRLFGPPRLQGAAQRQVASAITIRSEPCSAPTLIRQRIGCPHHEPHLPRGGEAIGTRH
jgi:pyrimidine-nucleoside phosphorylase